MLKNISIRVRLTIIIVLLLIVCCLGLTIILNMSAFKMATKIEAYALTPAKSSSEMESEPQQETPFSNLEASTLNPNFEESKMNFKIESFIYMLIIIVCGGGVTYYIAKKALKSLDTLNCQIKGMHIHNLSKPLPMPNTKDEIAEMTKSFNEMIEKLNESFILQENFAASAAHELRTPLAVLQTKIDVFKKKSTHTKKEYEDVINIFEKQTKGLRVLVQNLLNMARMHHDFEKSDIDLKNMLDEIISDLESITNHKNIKISLNCDDNIMIHENLDLLYRAFYNMVENAIKYNLDNGKVEIKVIELNREKILIKISDTGIGIANEYKKYIFEPFYRVDKSRSKRAGGVGLGLTIVYNIINKMGGKIFVSDNAVNGSCFNVILPR